MASEEQEEEEVREEIEDEGGAEEDNDENEPDNDSDHSNDNEGEDVNEILRSAEQRAFNARLAAGNARLANSQPTALPNDSVSR